MKNIYFLHYKECDGLKSDEKCISLKTKLGTFL